MKKLSLLAFCFISHIEVLSQAFPIDLATRIIKSSNASTQIVKFDFDDPRRFQWRRTPGVRNGIALYQMTLEQKKDLHTLLSKSLSKSGYQKITHILFNEDLARDFDPETGQNRYWVAFYGNPGDNLWGWRLEGHHLSLNFTLKGNEIISATPFELGSYPALVEKDSVRAGFKNLIGEVDFAFDLMGSFTAAQLKKVVISEARSNQPLMGESNTISQKIPLGLPVKEMNDQQRQLLKKLADEYLGNIEWNGSFDFSTLHFAWWGPRENPTAYSYRLHSNELLIDFDNIGNHIHCVMRFLKNDFATNPFKN